MTSLGIFRFLFGNAIRHKTKCLACAIKLTGAQLNLLHANQKQTK